MSAARRRRKARTRLFRARAERMGLRCCAPGDVPVYRPTVAADPVVLVDANALARSASANGLVLAFCCGRLAVTRRLGDGVPVCSGHRRR